MKRIVLTVLALSVAGSMGYFVGHARMTKTMMPTLDFMGHSHLSMFMEAALDAYRHEAPEIAAWALMQVSEHLENQLKQDYESQWFPRKNLKVDLMLTYARLSLTMKDTSPNLANEYARRACEIGSEVFSGKAFTEEELFAFLSRLDANSSD